MLMQTYGPDWGRFDNHQDRLINFNFTGMHKEIGEYIIDSTKERFRKGVAPDGSAWKPSRRAEETGGKTLMDSRVLYNSFTYRATASSVEVGTNVKYAAVHQGLDRSGQEVDEITIEPKKAKLLKFRIAGKWVSKNKVTIIARRYMGFNDEDTEEIGRIVDDRIEENLK